MMKAYDFEHGVVAARPEQIYSWPGITRVKDREILVTASERIYHVDPFGRVVIIRSLDDGKTWQLPQEIYNSELDDCDSNLLTRPDGTIALTWHTKEDFTQKIFLRTEWQARADRITQKMRDELVGSWLLRSFDGGYTWEKTPHRIPTGVHAGPTLLSDGSLIYLGIAKSEGDYRMIVFTSRNTGESREKIGEVPSPRVKTSEGILRPVIDENHVLELCPGNLLAFSRRDSPGYLYQAISKNGGKIWSEAKELYIWGCPPYLIRLKSGVILCSYDCRKESSGVRAILSYDNGETWDTNNIITLYEWEDEPDIGYPVSLEVRPGRILVVYYCSRQDSIHIRHERKIKGSTPEGLLYTKFTLT